MRLGSVCLMIAALVAFGTAIAHMSCIALGPACYAAQMAPPQIIESAKQGTLLAPLGTLLAPLGTTFVSAIFVLLGLYALSGAKVIRKLPLLTFGIYAIATLCIIRGLLALQLWVRKPELVTDFALLAAWVWLITGLLYLVGYKVTQRAHAKH
ncbi:hypothetical protein [Flocculibacter collagenilyticus]|uniref:hypothetical protein n=1 Tax=Flocculibacter collagenilyticus TaxID=2744479 RepID=UPI001F37B1E4|nr:hypothetical protein [Flocculibacter collagenilyticus]